MDENAPTVSNIQSYHDHFRKVSQTIKYQPLRQRTCNDKICYAIFIIITIAFIGIGQFYMRSTDIKQIIRAFIWHNQYLQYQFEQNASNALSSISYQNIKPAIPIIASMSALSILMAVVFLCLLVRFPICIFVTMLILGLLLIITVTVLLFLLQAYIPAAILCVIIAILIIVLLCTYKKIKTGLILLNTASRFLMQMPGVIFAPLTVILFVIVFQLFWALSLAAITIYKGNAKSQQQISNQQTINSVIGFFWGLFNLFYSFFFYYCIAFIIATAASFWYYNRHQNFLIKSIGRIMRYHIGSFTLASFLVSIVSLIRQYTDRQARQGLGPATICVFMLACCIKMTEDLLETLNHNAIITMSITGQSYFDSAKSALSLIYENFPLYILIDLMSHLVTFAGVFFISGFPSILGLILLKYTAENPDNVQSQVIGTIIIILFTMLVGGIFLSVLSQSLSCMFILFCLDRKFLQMGYPASQIAPKAIKEIFQQLGPYVGGEYNQHLDRNNNNGNNGNNNGNNQQPRSTYTNPQFY